MDKKEKKVEDEIFTSDFLDLDNFEDGSDTDIYDDMDDLDDQAYIKIILENKKENVNSVDNSSDVFSDNPSKSMKRMSGSKNNKSKDKSVAREILGWILYLAGVMVFTYLLITFVGQRTTVSGDSMYPTLHDGDNLIIDKISYEFVDPERYDIIVFPYQYETGKYYIKRIIGLPGETVLIQDGEVYIDGELLGEIYGYEIMNSSGIAAEEIVLGEDEYFVLGDNRNNSSDSRDPSVGVICGEDIVGKAFVRIWPLDSIGVISHE